MKTKILHLTPCCSILSIGCSLKSNAAEMMRLTRQTAEPSAMKSSAPIICMAQERRPETAWPNRSNFGRLTKDDPFWENYWVRAVAMELASRRFWRIDSREKTSCPPNLWPWLSNSNSSCFHPLPHVRMALLSPSARLPADGESHLPAASRGENKKWLDWT